MPITKVNALYICNIYRFSFITISNTYLIFLISFVKGTHRQIAQKCMRFDAIWLILSDIFDSYKYKTLIIIQPLQLLLLNNSDALIQLLYYGFCKMLNSLNMSFHHQYYYYYSSDLILPFLHFFRSNLNKLFCLFRQFTSIFICLN